MFKKENYSKEMFAKYQGSSYDRIYFSTNYVLALIFR